jgi:hypothetical protein
VFRERGAEAEMDGVQTKAIPLSTPRMIAHIDGPHWLDGVQQS